MSLIMLVPDAAATIMEAIEVARGAYEPGKRLATDPLATPAD